MKRFLLLVGLSPSLVPSISQCAEPVAVIATGRVEEAAEVQERLEKEVAELGYGVVSSEQLLTTLPDSDEPTDDRLLRVIENGLNKARDSYYRAEINNVRAQLSVVAEALAQLRAAGDLGRDYHVLQMAMLLDAGDEATARTHARWALFYDLDTTPDPDLYRPEVAALIAKERDLFLPAEIEVTGLPPGATVWLNGRQVEPTFKTIPVAILDDVDEVLVEVRAPKHRTRRVGVATLAGERKTIAVRLPYALSADAYDAVRAAVRGEHDLSGLTDIAGTFPVVVVARGDKIAVTRPLRSRVVVGDLEDSADWLGGTLRAATRELGPFLRSDLTGVGWQLSADAAMGWVVRSQDLSVSENASIDHLRTQGPALRVGADFRQNTRAGRILLELDLEARTARKGGGLVITDPAGDPFAVGPSNTFTLRTAGGLELPITSVLESFGEIVVLGESHQVSESRVQSVTTSYSRFGGGVRVGFTLSPSRAASFELGIDSILFHSAREPEVTFGNKIEKAREARPWLKGRWRLSRGLEAQAEFSYSYLFLNYAGTGNIPISPAPLHPQRYIRDVVVLASVRKSF